MEATGRPARGRPQRNEIGPAVRFFSSCCCSSRRNKREHFENFVKILNERLPSHQLILSSSIATLRRFPIDSLCGSQMPSCPWCHFRTVSWNEKQDNSKCPVFNHTVSGHLATPTMTTCRGLDSEHFDADFRTTSPTRTPAPADSTQFLRWTSRSHTQVVLSAGGLTSRGSPRPCDLQKA